MSYPGLNFLEAAVGLEPTRTAFAERRLTIWLRGLAEAVGAAPTTLLAERLV